MVESCCEELGNILAMGLLVSEAPHLDPKSRSRTEFLVEKSVIIHRNNKNGVEKPEPISA
jgi:hypothetical protein